MTKLEAIKKTRTRWMRLKPENRKSYRFTVESCCLCEYSMECGYSYCLRCPWAEQYGGIRGCAFYVDKFRWAETEEEAEMWKYNVIGMLLYLEERYENENVDV